MRFQIPGFSRLLDAAMGDDEMPRRAAQAFREDDYALKSLEDTESGHERTPVRS